MNETPLPSHEAAARAHESSPKPQGAEGRQFTRKGKRMKKHVSGYYYHAAEYHRKKQGERKLVGKILGGLVEPFNIHLRAARLRHYAKKYGGDGRSAVLDNEFVGKALEKKLTQQDIQEFRAKTQVRKVFKNYELSGEDAVAARSILQNIFDKKGQISAEERALYEQQLGKKDVDRLIQTAVSHGDAYLTAGEMRQRLSDEAIFGGLTPDQVALAKRIHRDAIFSTIFATAKYGVLGVLALNPFGLAALGGTVMSTAAGAGLSMVTSAGMRVASLNKEGGVYGLNKQKGIDQQHGTGWFNRLMGVDWDKDHHVTQVLRAAGVGAAIGLAFKFLPGIEHWAGDRLGDIHHTFNDHIAAAQAPGHPLGQGGMVRSQIPGETGPKASGTESLFNYEQSTNVHFLPDTQHHDWQQLHTYAMRDSHGNDYLKVSYMGQDDGVAHGQHFIDVMLPDKNGEMHHVFLQNDATFALTGEHANDPVGIFGLVNGHVQQIDTIRSVNLAHQLGLTQDSIKNFANLTHVAGSPDHPGLWHGTQNASDLQTIMPSRGLFHNQGTGNYLWGARMGGGHFENGNFYVGASNHYYDTSLLQHNVLKTDFPGMDIDDKLHSSLAGPLGKYDEFLDKGNSVPVIGGASEFLHDHGIAASDAYLAFAERFGWVGTAVAIAAPFAAGYLAAKHTAKTKIGKLGKGVAMGAVGAFSPVIGLPFIAGYWARKGMDKIRGKGKDTKGEKGEKPKQEGTHETPPASPGPGGAAGGSPVQGGGNGGAANGTPAGVAPAAGAAQAAAPIATPSDQQTSPPPAASAPAVGAVEEATASVAMSPENTPETLNATAATSGPGVTVSAAPAFPEGVSLASDVEHTAESTDPDAAQAAAAVVPPSTTGAQEGGSTERLEATAQAEKESSMPATVKEAKEQLATYREMYRDDPEMQRKIETIQERLNEQKDEDVPSQGVGLRWYQAFGPKREEPQEAAA